MQGLWVSTLTNILVLLDFPAAVLSVGPTATCGTIDLPRLPGVHTGTGGFPRSRRTGETARLCPEGRTGRSAAFLPQFTSRFSSHWVLQTKGVFLQTNLVPNAVQLLTCSVCFMVLLRFVSLTSNFQNIWGQQKCGFTGMRTDWKH